MRRIKTTLLAFAAIILAACNGIDRPYEGTYEKVLVYVGLGYNNLSSNLLKNFADMQEGVLPGVASNCAIVAFCHNTASSGDYATACPPQLIRVMRGPGGKPVADTLKTYVNMAYSPTKESLREALQDIQQMFPSRSYGMLFSSHGTGWIPAGYQSGNESSSIRQRAVPKDTQWPETKAIGNQYNGSAKNVRWLELADFVDAIPFQLDYLILDACLMGTVEVAWELRNVCSYVAFSPCEIPAAGLDFKRLTERLLQPETPDLTGVCDDYYTAYKEDSIYGATITLVDCSRLDPLADVCRDLFNRYRSGIRNLSGANVQVYDRLMGSKRYYAFFDLKDMIREAGATEADLATLQAALDQAIVFEAHTPRFIDVKLNRVCGLAMYLPAYPYYRRDIYHGTEFLDNFYKENIAWNTATSLVE